MANTYYDWENPYANNMPEYARQDIIEAQQEDPVKKSEEATSSKRTTFNMDYAGLILENMKEDVLNSVETKQDGVYSKVGTLKEPEYQYNKYDPYYHYDDDNNGINNSYNLAKNQFDQVTTGGELKYLLPNSANDAEDSSYALQASSLNGIFGIPYQFMPSVDRRIYPVDDNSLGRKYAEKIMTHAPLLMITPCRQKFMEGFKKNAVETVLQDLITESQMLQTIKEVGRYYTTKFAYDEYYKAVGMMCAEVAILLGIADKKISYGGKRTKIRDIDWYTQKNDAFSKYFAAKNSVVLYADGLVDLHDSFSNGTTDSSLASSVNNFSSQAREIMFLTNTNSNLSSLYNLGSDAISGITSGLQKLDLFNLTKGMLGDLATTGVNTVLSGGKIIFPKIWDNSNSSRSYSFDIKLRSPDHDTVSIYFNILVPYLHLLALCLPQSLTTGSAAQNPNAYDTPFLVRAYCKGMFNINMGIITDLSARRGAESQWNDQGLPTQMDISISIEDMYTNLVMSNPYKDGNFFSKMWNEHLDVVTNGEMIDFLSNLSGLNVAAETYSRRWELFLQLKTKQIKWLPSQMWHYFENGISNSIRSAYDRQGRLL